MSDRTLPDGLITLIKTASRALIVACAAPGQSGPERVEQMTGYSRGTISRWQGDAYRDLMPLDVVFQLESQIGKPIFSGMLAQLTGHRTEPIADPDAPSADLMGDVMRVTGSHARFSATAADALQDARISPREARDMMKAAMAHMDQMAGLMQRLAPLAGE